MKSKLSDLKKRGMVTGEEILSFSNLPIEELVKLLHSENACERSAAAINLLPVSDMAADELLTQLSFEKCLYTKISICESLEKGNIETAKKMSKFLGMIGNNQYIKLPEKVSAKKSYPLPRDIIARVLGKMDALIYPVLDDILKTAYTEQISEALDAIGFMVFYNPQLVNSVNVKSILRILNIYKDNEIIVWKSILCLSAFPLLESAEVLETYAMRKDILGKEAIRSLSFMADDFHIFKHS